MSKTKLVDLSAIRLDGNTLARESLDLDVVDDYAQAYRDDEKMPPVVLFFDGTDYWPGDGHHRIQAAFKADMVKIDAEVRSGGVRDAILFAVGSNETHGRKRTNADKRLCVELLLQDEEWSQWSDRAIAKAVRVGNDLVSRMRNQLSEKTVDQPRKGLDGKVRKKPQKAAEPAEAGPQPFDLEVPDLETLPPVPRSTDMVFDLSEELDQVRLFHRATLDRWPDAGLKALLGMIEGFAREIAAKCK